MRGTSIGHQEFKNGSVDLMLVHAFVMIDSLNEIVKDFNKTARLRRWFEDNKAQF